MAAADPAADGVHSLEPLVQQNKIISATWFW